MNSILNQEFSNFEIILVNNGSTDASKALCEGYQDKDPRVTVLHLEHGETALALNAGIEAASGRYLLFMSASDYIEEIDVLEEQRQEKHLPDKIWGKLIRRAMLSENDIKFDTDNVWADADFCMSLYVHASTYGDLYDLPSYHHTVKKITKDSKEWGQKIILTLSKWTSAADLQHQHYESAIHNWMAAMYCEELIPLCGKLKRAEMQSFRHSVDDFAWLMDIRENRSDKFVKYLCNTFGVRFTGCLIMVFGNFKSWVKRCRGFLKRA